MSVFHKILCPTDFSQPAQAALNLAISLANDGAGEIIVAYIEPDLDSMAASGALPEHQLQQEHQEAVRDLASLIERQTPAQVLTHALVRHGEVAPQLLQLAREQQVDLIVLAANSSEVDEEQTNALPYLGSVARHVLLAAPCPVLLINERTHANHRSWTTNQPENCVRAVENRLDAIPISSPERPSSLTELAAQI